MTVHYSNHFPIGKHYQQCSNKDICPYMFAYFVQVYLEQSWRALSIWQILLTVLTKWLHQFICPHMVLLWKQPEASESLLLKGCFPVTDVLQGLLCLGHWEEVFLNFQLWYFKTNTLYIMPSVNLYTVEVLLYICSRHLPNYWGAKVWLSIKYTKVAIPFCLPRNMQCRMASGEKRYTCCFFFSFFFKHSVVNTLKQCINKGHLPWNESWHNQQKLNSEGMYARP